jgi:hypothetical protein
MGHLLGYARVSTTDQHPQLQVDALQHAGCYRVFTETASGTRTDLGSTRLRPSRRRSGSAAPPSTATSATSPAEPSRRPGE